MVDGPPKILWIGSPSALSPEVERVFHVRFELVEGNPQRPGRIDVVETLHRARQDGFDPRLVLFWDPHLFLQFDRLEELEAPSAAFFYDANYSFPWQSELAHLFDSLILDINGARPYFWNVPQEDIAWCPFYFRESPSVCLNQKPEDERDWDVSFVGSMDVQMMPHRVIFFQELEKRLQDRHRVHFGRGSVSEIYSRSKIVINYSTRPAWCYPLSKSDELLPHAAPINARVCEAMAYGAMLLTDTPSTDVLSLFEEGRYLAAYSMGNVDEAVERIGYYLAHPEERLAIARRGWEEVQRNHMADSRGRLLASRLAEIMQRPARPPRSADRRRYALGRALLRMALHVPAWGIEASDALNRERMSRSHALLAQVKEESIRNAAQVLASLTTIQGSPRAAGEAWMALWEKEESVPTAIFLESLLRWQGQTRVADQLAQWRDDKPAPFAEKLEPADEHALCEIAYQVFHNTPKKMPHHPLRAGFLDGLKRNVRLVKILKSMGASQAAPPLPD